MSSARAILPLLGEEEWLSFSNVVSLLKRFKKKIGFIGKTSILKSLNSVFSKTLQSPVGDPVNNK